MQYKTQRGSRQRQYSAVTGRMQKIRTVVCCFSKEGKGKTKGKQQQQKVKHL